MTKSTTLPLWLAIIITMIMVIIVREGSVILCRWMNIESAANIVGMIIMFCLLIIWRLSVGLPSWITQASNTLLVDSGFAFLPVSAGAGLLLFALGDEFWGVILTILISTLIPLWGLALLTDRWLKPTRQPLHTATVNETGKSAIIRQKSNLIEEDER